MSIVVGQLQLHGVIGTAITCAAVREQLAEMGPVQELRLLVNSNGGVVTEGIALYYAIRSHTARKIAIVEGLAASMASVLVMAADEVRMRRGSYLMIHNPRGGAEGESHDLRRTAELLEKMEVTLLDIYESRTGIARDKLQEMMARETYMSAEEAVALGFADAIEEEDAEFRLEAVAQLDPKSMPAALRAVAQGVAMTEEEKAKMAALEEENARLRAALETKGAEPEEDAAKGEEEPEEEAAKGEGDPSEEESAKVAASAPSAIAPDPVAARLEAIEKRQEKADRVALYATRPDLTKEQIAALDKLPVASAKEFLATLPRNASNPVAAARAGLTGAAAPTVGASNASGVPGLTYASPEAHALDLAMGFAVDGGGVRCEGSRQIISAVRPRQKEDK